MAQTSLTPHKRNFSDPAKAREAGAKATHGAQLRGEFLDLRRTHVITLKLQGWTNAEIAAHFGLSIDTIERDIAAIKRDDLITKYERRFLGQLLPLAVRKLKKSLAKDDGNLADVEMVLKQFAKLSEQKHQRELVQGAEQEDTLESWARTWRARADATGPPPQAVDVDVVEESNSDSTESESGHPPTGEARVDGCGDAGSATADRPGAAEPSAPTGPNPSQSGVETAPEGGEGLRGDHTGDVGPGV